MAGTIIDALACAGGVCTIVEVFAQAVVKVEELLKTLSPSFRLELPLTLALVPPTAAAANLSVKVSRFFVLLLLDMGIGSVLMTFLFGVRVWFLEISSASLLSVDSTSPLCNLFFDFDLGSLFGDVVEGAMILLSGRAGGRPTARDGEDGCRESVSLLGIDMGWWRIEKISCGSAWSGNVI